MRVRDIERNYCSECKKVRFKEKRNNNIRRSVFSIMLLGLIISISYIAFYQPQIIYYNQDKIGMTKTQVTIFEGISDNFKEDNIVKSIVDICEVFDDRDSEIKCVHEIATMEFYYKDENHLFYTPTQTFKDGGVCRDWAVFFKAIYESMGFKTLLIFPPNHVYLEVFNGNDIWVIDQQLIIRNKSKNFI